MTNSVIPRISIFIPAYNAENHLSSVLKRISQNVWPAIASLWIINDGSTDNTAAEIDKLLLSYPNIRTYSFSENKGYGQAVKKALSLIIEEGPEYAICLHADGQYPPESIPLFIEKAESGQYDIVQGSRHANGTALKGGMPLYKYLAGKSLTALENMVFGLKMTDYHSGMLCYSRKALLTIPFDNLSDSFDFDLEVIASALKSGLKIGEVPIPTHYADETSHINSITYGLRNLKVMAKYVTGSYK
jgi:glycosyltransferase involved in cell wall biosynthesis